MADANPIPKPLRVCYTCEWYDPMELHPSQLGPPILGVENHRAVEVEHIVGPDEVFSAGQCQRMPPVFCYSEVKEKEFYEDESSQETWVQRWGEATELYTQPTVYGFNRCGEWRLREGLVLNATTKP